MSGFQFGGTPQGGASKGFMFGTPTATTGSTASPAGFGFAAKPATAGAGFSFGGTPTATTTAAAGGTPSTGFSFNTPGGQMPQMQQKPAGLTLGSAPASTVPAPAPTTGFGFGNVASLAQSSKPPGGTAGAGFGFGTAAGATTATAAPTLGGTTLGQGAPTGFSLGGATAAAAAAKPPTLGGGMNAGFNFTTPAKTTSGGFSLGGTTAAPAAAATGTSQLSGLLGGSTAAPAGSTGFSLGGTTAAPSTGLGTGLGTLGALGAVTQAAAATTPATAASTGFSLPSSLGGGTSTGLSLGGTTGGLGLSLGGAATTTSAPAAPTSSTATTGLTLGAVGGTQPVSSTGFALGGSSTLGTGLTGAATTTTTPVSLTTATTTTSSTAAASTTNMTYQQLEEVINKWTLELEEQEKVFLQQATQVNGWDRLLIDNADKITELNNDVECVKIDQQRLDHELDFILAQQRELEDMLAPLQKSVEQLPPVNYQQHADLEREHTYQLAENVDAQLKLMVQDLKEIIEHLNSSQASQDSSDPIQQIAKILNAHTNSLQWIDQNSAFLQRRVEEVAKQAELRRKEQERNFRLAYD